MLSPRRNGQPFAKQLSSFFGFTSFAFTASALIICFLEFSVPCVCAVISGGATGAITCYLISVIKRHRITPSAQNQLTDDADEVRLRVAGRHASVVVCTVFGMTATVILAYVKGAVVSACFLCSSIGAFSFIAYMALAGHELDASVDASVSDLETRK